MKTTIQKWGNSGNKDPKIILDDMNWSANEVVEIIPDKDSIIIKKAKEKSAGYLETFYNKDIDTILKGQDEKYTSHEYDWGKPMGKELW